ncbi:hypothetical protein LUZ63_016649 [Rhynchospora breviuscula]|uniref:Uncharacterized protein n=1 Tax=Rhynchospora breviuscula TaxID=2022672 RepID=A0A9P9ZAA6_9POAL|nr:hypothetical protein LUZ63_016649 [Rhynchospora breviuscula]
MEIRQQIREWLYLRPRVRSVWALNLVHEFHLIIEALEGGNYNRATLDTEFMLDVDTQDVPERHPRFVTPEERYHTIRMKTDNGIIRQLGLTLSADDGSVLVWEFNFILRRRNNFIPLYSPFNFAPLYTPAETEEFLGMQLEPIDSNLFSRLLLSSGLLHNNRITWILFHGAYDIVFFIKLATFWGPLPHSLLDFKSLIMTYLGERILDVKYIISFTPNLYGGLGEVAAALGIERVVGRAHRAGSDSLLTWYTYRRMADIYFPLDGGMRHAGVLYGIDHI